ncbi:LOW QUALITY PROTEIN: uncharacterized protein B0I36DRAFT_318742 [Microdochium trichocladiopsis]|uniref:Polynucleotide adenylyltransferase n=1 Tax=Microdochium trichocladiopsis TaxID=1682393 RepID=A0A9P8YBU8_9PEZI|nr:LOW QUALITY PROTEIN: uncharacterized protein B0I36DRAFT_318742 [Microdochium trichocladiopsis]KAH7035618.1 LOW QUALITY PROTEIN: hypothetical protein B0I36DRAFT_318742 [Microdochium trichocladiopsis]
MQSHGSSSPLEDRLRGLILSNDTASPDGPSGAVQGQAGFAQDAAALGPSAEPPQGPQRSTKKRPNQAQRRQMNAQLTIPIDVRQTSAPIRDTRPTGQSFHPGPRSHQAAHRQDLHQGQSQGRGQDARGFLAAHQQGPPGFQHGETHRGFHGVQTQDWRQRQHTADQRSPRGVNAIQSNGFAARGRGSQHGHHYQANGRQYFVKPEELANQAALLDWLCHQVNSGAEIEPAEIAEKENFRLHVQSICQAAVHQYEAETNQRVDFRPESVELKCFGSLMSGFATKAADMDLGIHAESPIPRIIEKALLDAGFGARLLSRTRVPIIKLCERPSAQLYRALVENRRKWENGIVEEDHDVDEDVHEPQDGAHDSEFEPQTPVEPVVPQLLTGEQEITSSTRKAQAPPASTRPRQWSLKQSPNQNLANYYGQAKKLIRQLNARDLTHSNSNDFTPSDYVLLNEVCEAFVSGLHEKALQQRLQNYPSYHNSAGPQGTPCRSLMGVFKMAEGESLVMLYENKTINEDNYKKEALSKAVVQAWQSLHHRPGISQNPLAFNKELQHSVETLRQIPSVQLMQLSQEQHEPAATYHARTLRALRDLSGPEGPTSDVLVLSLAKYVAGIYDVNIREQVREFASSSDNRSLHDVALKHKILQLVDEYQKALDKELYAARDVPIVRAYIDLLLRGAVDAATDQPVGPAGSVVVIPISRDSAPLVEKIQLLPDPSKLAPNQPKDKYNDKLEFPKSDIGVQCDINFSAHLALQNTLLLRCYSRTDSRVRPMHWARVRGINTSYRGTLSSYGYVLMVLHYLVNPFVCPNLQLLAPPDPNLPPEALEGLTTCKGYNVRFWPIQALASSNRLNQNEDSIGTLLRGFFDNKMSTANKRGFDWGRDGGLLTKQEKGWTGAKTPQSGLLPHSEDQPAQETPSDDPAFESEKAQAEGGPTADASAAAKPAEYLFAIEDPFETEHNVARTVTHNGIVSIRDEFRRAWRIIKSAGRGPKDLLEDEAEGNKAFAALLKEIHGLA